MSLQSNGTHKVIPATHLILLRDDEILLQRRFNTGYEDGNYSLVAGHVESGETVTHATIREAREETGIELLTRDLDVAHVMQRKSQSDERIDFFLVAEMWRGVPTIREPSKCDALNWFPKDSLPTNTIPYIRNAVAAWLAGNRYSEFGWS